MDAFIIFAVVLTIAYAMYYGAMIMIDLNAAKRSDSQTEENIAADGGEVDTDSITPKSVVESPDGGFSFEDSGSEEEDTANEPEPIEEPIENEPDESEDENQSTDINESDDQHQGEDEGTEDADVSEEEDQQPAEEQAETETSEADGDDEVLNITPDTPNMNEATEEYDANSAFDPNLIQPAIGVQRILGPQASEAVCQQAALINESLTTNRAKGRIEASASVVKNIIKNKKLADACNIATQDDVQRY